MKTVLDIDTSKPVLVTGASGYVAGWIVKRLLELGITVHAAVRDPSDTRRLAPLTALAKDLPGTLRLFKADLLEDGSYADAMQGCSIVFHTASPFKLDIRDAQRELVDPALKGTRNVLETANRCPSVTRVVLTSSCAAIYGDNADLEQVPGGVLTEAVWNTSSSLDHQAYSYSKTVAEKEAWSIAEKQSRWTLVVVNPSLVIGPGINPFATSESFNLIRQFGDGRLRTGVPDIGVGVVDVRDLAEAHLRAAWIPSASGRHIISAHDTSFPALARTLLDRFGKDFPVPRRTLPRWLVWLVGPLADRSLTRRMVTRNVGYAWRANNRKSIEELGMSYRPLPESMEDFFQQLVDSGQVTSRC